MPPSSGSRYLEATKGRNPTPRRMALSNGFYGLRGSMVGNHLGETLRIIANTRISVLHNCGAGGADCQLCKALPRQHTRRAIRQEQTASEH